MARSRPGRTRPLGRRRRDRCLPDATRSRARHRPRLPLPGRADRGDDHRGRAASGPGRRRHADARDRAAGRARMCRTRNRAIRRTRRRCDPTNCASTGRGRPSRSIDWCGSGGHGRPCTAGASESLRPSWPSLPAHRRTSCEAIASVGSVSSRCSRRARRRCRSKHLPVVHGWQKPKIWASRRLRGDVRTRRQGSSMTPQVIEPAGIVGD